MIVSEEIYGTKIIFDSKSDYVEDWGYADEPKMQYWRKLPLPDYFNNVEYDRDGNALLTTQQREYATEEVRRCKEGFAFLNNGSVEVITGKNYFYLQWWKLEDDIYPDYRDLDRRYFQFLNHWENISWCLGIIIGKKRRQGATSIATSNIVYECLFYKNSFCGLTSKTQTDAKSAFTNMISFGYRQLPVFLKPKQLNNKDSVSELVFAHKTVDIKGGRGSAIDNDAGHRSRIDYRAPSLNAYDSGRLSRGLFDEGAKWPKEVPFSTFLAIVSKTLVKGAKRVGFLECPSTTNAMTNGGAEFKVVWDGSDQFKYERTPRRFVKYITPAYDGYYGFIGRYGESVIDPPTEEQYNYLVENFVGAGDLTEADIKLGAKGYLIERRMQKEGTDLEEEIRMNPFSEKEMFDSANTGCIFNSLNLNERKHLLQLHEKELIETGNFLWKDGVRDSKVEWVADPNGRWQVVKEFMEGFLKEKADNATENRGGLFFPKNDFRFGGAVDPYDHDVVEDNRRSKAGGLIKQKKILDNFDDKFAWCDICKYIARPLTAEEMYEDMIKMFSFFSCRMLPETQKPGIMAHFRRRGYGAFLMILPGYSEPGIPSTPDNKQTGAEYVEYDVQVRIDKYYFIDVIDDLLQLDLKKTQKYDLGMTKLWTEVACLNKFYEKRGNGKLYDIGDIYKQYNTKAS